MIETQSRGGGSRIGLANLEQAWQTWSRPGKEPVKGSEADRSVRIPGAARRPSVAEGAGKGRELTQDPPRVRIL